MSAFARWYLAVAVLGALALPLTWRLFPRLPDRGYCVSKLLAIVLVGFTLWTGTAYGLLRNDVGGALLAVLAVACASGIAGWSALWPTARGASRLVEGLRRRLPLIVAAEALFLVAFGGWTLVRARIPDASHTEQPMDLMFLTAVWTSPAFPPRDPWLAGYPISYYYFGHWLLATVARLTALPPEVAYNAGQACWFGLLLSGCFGVGFNLAALARPSRAASRGAGPITAGLLAALAVGVVGNLQGVLDAIGALGAGRTDWWWWSSSRVVIDRDLLGRPVTVIDEFPFFSYLLGDNHAHVLAMPVVVLVATLGLSLSLAGSRGHRSDLVPNAHTLRRFPGGAPGLAVTLIAAGSTVFLNAWDVPAVWALLILAAAVAPWRSLGLLLLLPVGTAVAYFPYLLTAQGGVSGFLPNLFNPTSPGEVARMWGVFAPGLLALFWVAADRRRPGGRRIGLCSAWIVGTCALCLLAGGLWAFATSSGRAWLARLSPSQGVALALERWTGAGVTLVILAVLLALTLALIWSGGPAGAQRRGSDPGSCGEDRALRFALVLGAVGLGLLLTPELGFVADGFGTRMNTVFKLYYGAWLLLALAASHGTFIALREHGVARGAAMASLALLGAGLAFPAAGLSSRLLAAPGRAPTLDALAYVEATDPDEMAAIQWVRAHTRPDSRVLQVAGTSYRVDEARLSAATGRATLLGWQGHELAWRGDAFGWQAAGRAEAARDVYGAGVADSLDRLLDAWRIDYLYVGPRERATYGITPETEAHLGRAMELAFARGAVRIYRRRG